MPDPGVMSWFPKVSFGSKQPSASFRLHESTIYAFLGRDSDNLEEVASCRSSLDNRTVSRSRYQGYYWTDDH